MPDTPEHTPELTSELTPDAKKKRSQRNLAIALGLFAFVAVVFIVSILKISGNVAGAG
ncbi:MAG: hypothetical protein KDD85_12475 [Parvularculaceae bacterium]|nr:hypothetical protein [Parvularculaceae bacterium]